MSSRTQKKIETPPLDADEVRRQATEICEKVEQAPPDKKSRVFFDGLRAGVIPYLPCHLQDETGELYKRSSEALFLLGRTSIPLTVGFTMHVYNLSALATLPVPAVPDFERRRQTLVDTIRRYRSLLAISSFGENIKHKDSPFLNVIVTPQADGTFVASGRKGFQSMASEADLLLFSGLVGEEQGMFYTSIKDQSALKLGDSLFAGAMAPSDTRPIQFDNLILKQRNVLSLSDELTDHVSFYATAWFEALIASVYLGGAARALEEVRKFALSVHADEDVLLAELDGFLVDAGRLGITLRSALTMVAAFGPVADRYTRGVREGAPASELDGLASDLMDMASMIKYSGTKAAAEIVNGARGLIGSRSMSVKHPIHALTEQICFGPLHPTIPARLERSVGHDCLVDKPFMGLFEWAGR